MENKTTCHAVIVGCDLGGFPAAIVLRRHGHDVMVFDQAAQLSEVCINNGLSTRALGKEI